MSTSVEKAVLGAFVGDSLSLGVHWVYDANKIKEEVGAVDRLLPPTLNQYHKGKSAGDFTNYGDTMLILLESIAAKKTFDVEDFRQRWVTYWKTSTSYNDSATKTTMKNLEEGKIEGLDTNDFSAVGRQAPLLLVAKDEEQLVQFAIQQCRVTHENKSCIQVTEFVSRILWRVVHQQMKPTVAIQEVLNKLKDKYEEVAGLILKGIETKDISDEEAYASYVGTKEINGRSFPVAIYCYIPGALPITIRVLYKCENDSFEKVLTENAELGGDNATRSLILGAVFGSRANSVLPSKWVDNIRKIDHIRELLKSLQK